MSIIQVSILSIFIPCLLWAHNGSVSSATGRTGYAAVEASETPYLNPAGLGYMRGYYFLAGFGSSHQNGVDRNQDLNIGLIDTMPETVVPTAFVYNQNSFRLENQTEDIFDREFRLSFGNLINKNIAFGLSVVHQDTKVLEQKYQQTNADLGFLWVPNANLGAALVFKNIFQPKDTIPSQFRQNEETGLGFSYNYRKFVRIKTDIKSNSENRFDRPIFGAGMESYLNKWLILRWGGERNTEKDQELYSAGMGFIGPKFGLHYAFQNSPQNEGLTRHSVDLAIPIW